VLSKEPSEVFARAGRPSLSRKKKIRETNRMLE
jgi:hypothetical protein